jgi:L-cystine transport system substrate-binding protein
LKSIKTVKAAVVVLGGIALFAGCAKKAEPPAASAGSAGAVSVQKVRYAHTQNLRPYDYVNEQGAPDGFEVAVIHAVDDLIPEYEFEDVPTSDDDLLIGVQSGKYALGTKGAWVTAERKEKYIFAKNYVAASIVGITYRSADSAKITDIDSFAAFSGKLVPIAPQSAQYAVVEDYNKSHTAAPVKLVPSESFDIADAYTWIVEGRYDAFLDLKLNFSNNVASEGGAWYRYAERLKFAPYRAIPTYALFNRNMQDLADKYDAAFETLRGNGTLTQLSNKYFGEDIFQYIK